MGFSTLAHSYSEYGKLRANPDAYTGNSLRLESCNDCGDNTTCRDSHSSVIDSGARTIISVEFQGVVYTPASPINPSDTVALLAWMKTVLEKFEYDVLHTATWVVTAGNSGTLAYNHYGQGTVAKFTLDDNSDLSFTRCCTIENQRAFRLLVEGTVANMVYNNNSHTLANNPYPFSGTPATDTATAAQLKTDFEAGLTALGVTFTEVLVEANQDAAGYYVNYKTGNEAAVYIGTTAMVHCGWFEVFNCP